MDPPRPEGQQRRGDQQEEVQEREQQQCQQKEVQGKGEATLILSLMSNQVQHERQALNTRAQGEGDIALTS